MIPLAPAAWWHPDAEGRIVCDLCPRACALEEGRTGFCGVRTRKDDLLWTSVYAQASGFATDPIEKKPLFHVLPGSKALSFGSLGCTLACTFCQNWRISRARDLHRLEPTTPEAVVRLAQAHACRSVAFTYNEPSLAIEFVTETALACREAGLLTIAVTSGYLSEAAREAFFAPMDAANVDLKAFTETFYHARCAGHLAPVLETLAWLARESRVWLEVTNLLIPGLNDTPEETAALAAWMAGTLGPDVPLHFTAFHPDHHLRDVPPTPLASLNTARTIARGEGLRFVYLGNVQAPQAQDTRCPGCGALVVSRSGPGRVRNLLEKGACPSCMGALPGRWT